MASWPVIAGTHPRGCSRLSRRFCLWWRWSAIAVTFSPLLRLTGPESNGGSNAIPARIQNVPLPASGRPAKASPRAAPVAAWRPRPAPGRGTAGRNPLRTGRPSRMPESGRRTVVRSRLPELAELPGVGETLARRIVEVRRERGPFADHEDLRRVRGIGPRTLERLRPYLLPMAESGGRCLGQSTSQSLWIRLTHYRSVPVTAISWRLP